MSAENPVKTGLQPAANGADNIVSLQQAKEERKPHLSGFCRCLACKHQWVGVAPVGVVWLECPSCSLERGRFISQAERNEPHWHCHCGNDLFFVSMQGPYCPNCGTAQKF